MVKRERRQPEPGEFEDPLSNYDGPAYADEFERSLSEDALTVMDIHPFLAVRAEQSIDATLKLMAANDGACVVVVNADNVPVGIFSERDVMNRVAERLTQIAADPVKTVMTPDPVVVHATDTPARVLNMMASRNIRHIPVVDADGKLVGVIGARRLTAYLQHHFPQTVTG